MSRGQIGDQHRYGCPIERSGQSLKVRWKGERMSSKKKGKGEEVDRGLGWTGGLEGQEGEKAVGRARRVEGSAGEK